MTDPARPSSPSPQGSPPLELAAPMAAADPYPPIFPAMAPPVPPSAHANPHAPPPLTPARARKILRSLISAAILLLLGLLTLVATGWNYGLLLEHGFLRTTCLAMVIVTGVSATLCLGGTMRCLDALLDLSPPPHWSWRVLIDPAKRLLLAAQLLTTATALLAIALLVLNRDLPAFLR